MSEDIWAELRKPFTPGEVGKLPRVTCGDCSDRRKECSKHSKSKCNVCGAWVSEKHIHINYVGHADVTSRLLEADPEWGWDFRSKDVDPHVLAAAAATGDPEVIQAVLDNAPPKFDLDRNGEPVGLWIKLTVGGVTRLGYGSVPSGQADAVKVLIGDALRNAAMRFGVALDLWAKGDRADPTAENATASAGRASRRGGGQSAGDVFEQAAPAHGRSRQAHHAARSPVPLPRLSLLPLTTARPDQDAQQYADQAHGATTLGEVKEIHQKAREAGKIGAFIRSPSSGKTGKLALYINWKRKQLKDVEAAWEELNSAAGKHRTSIADL